MAREGRRGGFLEGALMEIPVPSEPDASVSGVHDFVPHDPENVGQDENENAGQDVNELRLLVATVDAQISLATLNGPESGRSSRQWLAPPEVPEVEPEPVLRKWELLAAEAEAPPAVASAAGSFGRGLSLDLNSSARWSMVSSSDIHGEPDLPQVFRSEHAITRTSKPGSPHDGGTGDKETTVTASPEARTSKGWHTLRNRWKSHRSEATDTPRGADTPRGTPRHGGKHSHPAVEELRPWTDSLFRPLVPTPILQVGARGRVPRGGRRPPALEAIQG